MVVHWKKALWGILLIPFVAAGIWLFGLERGLDLDLGAPRGAPLQVVVMDPLCGRLAHGDLPGPHRDYAPLGRFLEEILHRPVELSYGDHPDTIPRPRPPADLIVGRESVVLAEANRTNEPLRPIARLTDDLGSTELSGLFVTRADDPAQTIGDLADHKIVFGPPADEERHSRALAALSQVGIVPVPPLAVVADCREALQAVAGREADAAVIPSYALGLLDGENAAGSRAFRVVGRTGSQPFITAFVAGRTGPVTERTVAEALFAIRAHTPLLEALRSKAGFVSWQDQPAPKQELPALVRSAAPPPRPTATEWTDWRGPGRAGTSPDVPAKLPATVRILWKRGLTGPGLSGVAATATRVIVADKSPQKDQDIWRCLNAETGEELWTVAYATPRQMEFTNTPRATPVIHGNFVYLLGAFGDLHCVNLYGSGVVWRRNIIKDFDARLPAWGMCSTPLIVGDSLIVNPGAPDASLAALSLYTGEVLWKTPGGPPAYGSLILGTFGGVRQIVGHDADSLGGWDPNTGQRLWTLTPEKKDNAGPQQRCANVPTPVNVLGQLLVATAGGGTRLHNFDPDGRIRPVPVEQTRALAPDTSTPVVVDGLVFGCAHGLFCLDLNDHLQTLYAAETDGAFKEYTSLIAGPDRVLAVTVRGELILFEAARDAFTPIGRLRVFHDAELWSHPALVGNRLYLRSMNEICCLLLDN